MDCNSEYLTKNIITYLGNKRKLLNFINNEVNKIIENDKDLSARKKEDIKIFDIFSGSGVVSRLFKQAGYTVYSNDLEVYSKAINDTFINTNEEDLEGIFNYIPDKLRDFYNKNSISFKDSETTDSYLNTVCILNSVRDLGETQTKPYFSIHYSPKDTNKPDFENERLFYTQENGRFLDSILEVIFNKDIFKTEKSKNIILADLFNKMTVNINTSGVMKGFHNGWGGAGANAVERICADMQLTRLELLSNKPRGESFNNFAENVFKPEIDNQYTYCDDSVDIIYADPPYNQHQYSANYHLLTTAYNNRDYITGDVGKGTRAGIRTDHNRSKFSTSRLEKTADLKDKVSGAYIAFDEFIKSVMDKSKYVIVSYNQEGVLNHSELINVLSQGGINNISIKTKKHEKFKGGKNTNISNSTVEYLFIVKTNTQQKQEEIQKIKESLTADTNKILLLNKYVNIDKALQNNDCEVVNMDNGNYIISLNKTSDNIVLNNDYQIIEDNIEGGIDILNIIASIEYADFEKEQLLNKYLTENKLLQAIKILKCFKITKLKPKLLEYLNKMNDLAFTDKEYNEFNKLKRNLKVV